MAKATLLNFRCPDDLWAAIERIGGDRHPVPEAERHHRSTRDYDLTATVLDIIRAGIVTLDGDESILDKTISKTVNKTDIEAMIHEAIAPLNDQMLEIMEELKRVKVLTGVVVQAERSTDNEDKPINNFPDVETVAVKTPQASDGGLSNRELHEHLGQLGIEVNLRTVQIWSKKTGKTPPTTKPRGKEVITVPSYVLRAGKWYKLNVGD